MSLDSQIRSAKITRCLNFCPEHVTKLCIWDCLPSHDFLIWGSEESRVNEIQVMRFFLECLPRDKTWFFKRLLVGFSFLIGKKKKYISLWMISIQLILEAFWKLLLRSLVHYRCGGVVYRSKLAKRSPSRTKQGHWDLGVILFVWLPGCGGCHFDLAI